MPSPKLNLIVLRFYDLDAAAYFYSGLGFALEREQHGSGPVHYSCQTGSIVLELYPLKSGENYSSSTMLGFSVSSINEAILDAAANGGSVLVQPKESERGIRAVVLDPGGHKLELIEDAAS